MIIMKQNFFLDWIILILYLIYISLKKIFIDITLAQETKLG